MSSKLKPLYANLKRLNMGSYLSTTEFKLYSLENNLDEIWETCKREVIRNKRYLVLDHRNTEDEEEAFMLMMAKYYEDNYYAFDDFILTILLNFAIWSKIKLDFTGIISNLRSLGFENGVLLEFIRKFKKTQLNKPLKLEDDLQQDEKSIGSSLNTKKVFVVHGRDDIARLELVNLLKDDFKLEPIVLSNEPNDNIETIISKFERLAKDCSVAIVLFTPDDISGDFKRARQNVILELGYFLGKFHDTNNRRIIILKKGEIEIPSDISGVLYLEFSKAIKEVYYDLRKQFSHWGYSL